MKLDESPTQRPETTANVQQWKWLNSQDFRDMDQANTIAMVSCSPMEVHGPHLPVITDRLEARALSYGMMERLCARDESLKFVELPPMYVATDVVPQPGSLNFRPSTIIRVIEDLGRSLAAQGFKHIWISSFHGGPRHWVALEVAANRVSKRYGVKMISLFSMLVGDLTEGRTDVSEILAGVPGVKPEWLDGDMHGGFLETALMLHLAKPGVAPHEHLEQRVIPAHIRHMGMEEGDRGLNKIKRLLQGFAYTVRHYERETYVGYPGKATAEIGEEILATLCDLSTSSLEDVLAGRRSLDECRSPLWPLRHLFMSERTVALFYKIINHRSQVF